jgi:hypothetical protein
MTRASDTARLLGAGATILDGITNSELNVSNQISESQTPITANGVSW